MAQKSAKSLAARNTKRLNQTHMTTLSIHLISLLLRLLRITSRLSTRSIGLHFLFSAPALAIEFWLEKSARPTTKSDGSVRAGEDLDGPGVMEWCWDVVYWSWGCAGLAGVIGDKAWYAWVVVPCYTVWSVWAAYNGVKAGFGGMAGAAGEQDGAAGGGQSKRQAKMEKRGGQKMQYR